MKSQVVGFVVTLAISYLILGLSADEEIEEGRLWWPKVTAAGAMQQLDFLTGAGGLDYSFYNLFTSFVNQTRQTVPDIVNHSNFTLVQLTLLAAVGAIAAGAATIAAEAYYFHEDIEKDYYSNMISQFAQNPSANSYGVPSPSSSYGQPQQGYGRRFKRQTYIKAENKSQNSSVRRYKKKKNLIQSKILHTNQEITTIPQNNITIQQQYYQNLLSQNGNNDYDQHQQNYYQDFPAQNVNNNYYYQSLHSKPEQATQPEILYHEQQYYNQNVSQSNYNVPYYQGSMQQQNNQNAEVQKTQNTKTQSYPQQQSQSQYDPQTQSQLHYPTNNYSPATYHQLPDSQNNPYLQYQPPQQNYQNLPTPTPNPQPQYNSNVRQRQQFLQQKQQQVQLQSQPQQQFQQQPQWQFQQQNQQPAYNPKQESAPHTNKKYYESQQQRLKFQQDNQFQSQPQLQNGNIYRNGNPLYPNENNRNSNIIPNRVPPNNPQTTPASFFSSWFRFPPILKKKGTYF